MRATKPFQRDTAAEALIPGMAELGEIIEDLERLTMYEFRTVCPRCGQREIWMSKSPMTEAEYEAVCRRCSDAQP